MNLYPIIAKQFDLFLNEKFKVEGEGELIFQFTQDGLFVSVDDDNSPLPPLPIHNELLHDILLGKKKIIPCSFRPKENEVYYYVQWASGQITVEATEYHADDSFHAKQLYCQNVFPTKEEAECQRFKIFKKITGNSFLPRI